MSGSVTEKDKCEDMVNILNAMPERDDLTFSCVEREDCHSAALQEGDAHLVALDGGDLFATAEAWGAVPVLAENYDDSSATEYHTVVAMRASQCRDDTTLYDLQNLKACSTGYRKTAGWRMPIGMLMKKKVMPEINDNCDANNDAESAAAFFSGMCAPGASAGTADDDALTEQLCKSCKSDQDGSSFCVKGVDAYQGYDGALTCLEEGAGDVAFIKHTTIPDHTFASGSADDYKLLCPQGGCVPYSEFATCKWATVPSHAVVVNPMRVGHDVRNKIRTLFTAAASHNPFTTLFFKTAGGTVVNEGDLVFKSSTRNLQVVDTDMIDFMGAAYSVYQELALVENKPCSGESPSSGGGGGGGGGVPGWGVAVIVIVVLIAVAMFTLVMVMWRKERMGRPMFSPII